MTKESQSKTFSSSPLLVWLSFRRVWEGQDSEGHSASPTTASSSLGHVALEDQKRDGSALCILTLTAAFGTRPPHLSQETAVPLPSGSITAFINVAGTEASRWSSHYSFN